MMESSLSSAPSPPSVALVYVARGEATLAPAVASISQAASWAASLSRLHFHVLAGERCLADANAHPVSVWFSQVGFNARAQHFPHVTITNATDAALHRRLSPLGRSWLQHTLTYAEKTHSYTVPKLFLFELLPLVEVAITLDTDVVALADVTRLFQHVHAEARADPEAALFYAAEQQNKACAARVHLRSHAQHCSNPRVPLTITTHVCGSTAGHSIGR